MITQLTAGHAPLIINPGIYRKMIEWEYDPFAKVIQNVVD